VADSQKQLKEEMDLRSQRAGMLRKAFDSHANSAPFQYLASERARMESSSDEEYVQAFRHWFNKEHENVRNTLMGQAGVIADNVYNFHRSMDKFHKDVRHFNSELQKHFKENTAFDRISNLEVNVVSVIDEQEYWPVIQRLAKVREDWHAAGDTGFPPEEFISLIERLMNHWNVSHGISANYVELIKIRGQVMENGSVKKFTKASELENISSNGLSYLIMISIFIGFIQRLRRDSKVNLTWALDELKNLDESNIPRLLDLLKRNHITLVTAYPGADPETLSLFEHRYMVEPDRRLKSVKIERQESFMDLLKEAEHV